MVSSLLGSGVIQWSGMVTLKADNQDCDFEALPYLIVIFQILVPMLVGIPAIFLIPNTLQTERLIDWEQESWYEDRADELAGSNGEDDLVDAEDSRLEPHLL